eukprot:7707101-Pyramimonas_sp.AAC.1
MLRGLGRLVPPRVWSCAFSALCTDGQATRRRVQRRGHLHLAAALGMIVSTTIACVPKSPNSADGALA